MSKAINIHESRKYYTQDIARDGYKVIAFNYAPKQWSQVVHGLRDIVNWEIYRAMWRYSLTYCGVDLTRTALIYTRMGDSLLDIHRWLGWETICWRKEKNE